MKIHFFCEDRPRPGGSKRAIYSKKQNRAFIIPDNKHTKTWRNSVRAAARDAYQGEPIAGAVKLTIVFLFRRPKSHYRTGKFSRMLKDSAPQEHIQKPDRTKLLRSTEDSMKGICWLDDSQVTCGPTEKSWVHLWEREGAMIVVEGEVG